MSTVVPEAKIDYFTQGKFGKIYIMKYDYTNSLVAKCPHIREFNDKIDLKLHFEKAFHELEMTQQLRNNPWFNNFHQVTMCLSWPLFISRLWDGTLNDLIQDPERWTFEDKLQVSILIVRALLTAQRAGVYAHQDLKPDNIFIRNFSGKFVYDDGSRYLGNEGVKYSVKIGDLGMANAFMEFGRNSASRPYQSPEQFSNDQIELDSAKKIDVFSLGILLHEIFSDGYHPLGIKTVDFWPQPLNKEKKWTRETIWKKWANQKTKDLNLLSGIVSDDLKQKIQQMLSPVISSRPDLSELIEHLCCELQQKNKKRFDNIRLQIDYLESQLDTSPETNSSDWPNQDLVLKKAREFYRDF